MIFMQCRCSSGVLGRAVSINFLVPSPGKTAPRGVMYLLHGLSDDDSIWYRRTSVERYAEQYNLLIVMPDGGRSFYTDAVAGDNYWTFISEELPDIVENIFNLRPARENTFAAGLSMGGYGALKLGLRCPDKFAAVAGLSSVTDIKCRFRAETSKSWRPELYRIFGGISQLAPRGNDLFDLAQKAVDSGKQLPKILSICGRNDFMIRDNRKFNKFMQQINYPDFHSFERPGSHTWEFWDEHIQDALKFFNCNTLPE